MPLISWILFQRAISSLWLNKETMSSDFILSLSQTLIIKSTEQNLYSNIHFTGLRTPVKHGQMIKWIDTAETQTFFSNRCAIKITYQSSSIKKPSFPNKMSGAWPRELTCACWYLMIMINRHKWNHFKGRENPFKIKKILINKYM